MYFSATIVIWYHEDISTSSELRIAAEMHPNPQQFIKTTSLHPHKNSYYGLHHFFS